MKKRASLKPFSLIVFLSVIFIFATVLVSVSEMILNDNVNIEGELFLEGAGGRAF